MIKNLIIVILIVLVAVFGVVVFSKEGTTPGTNNTSNTQSSESTPSSKTSSGKTVDLSNKGLKQVASSVFEDTQTGALDVSNNQLTGALPGELRKLRNLEVLDASDNNLTGIPAEIGQLSKLRTANFANNDISGLPLEIGNLSSLETLDLRGNPNVSSYDLGLIRSKIPNANILVD
ncbi:MAG: hypothetical protein KIH63_000045 [Candidatus Saccharibacteria bacterium]|nr:hypothetical protein [Candidatus Saccharibacteria bacterium]